MKSRGTSSSPTAGVLIMVGAGVAVLMAMWPLMVAFSEVAAIGLGAVAVLALGALALEMAQAGVRTDPGTRVADRRRHTVDHR